MTLSNGVQLRKMRIRILLDFILCSTRNSTFDLTQMRTRAYQIPHLGPLGVVEEYVVTRQTKLFMREEVPFHASFHFELFSPHNLKQEKNQCNSHRLTIWIF